MNTAYRNFALSSVLASTLAISTLSVVESASASASRTTYRPCEHCTTGIPLPPIPTKDEYLAESRVGNGKTLNGSIVINGQQSRLKTTNSLLQAV